jgi:hypothetical protein
MRIAAPGPMLRALTSYREFLLARPSIVAGDFNNHQRWERHPTFYWRTRSGRLSSERKNIYSRFHRNQRLREKLVPRRERA